MSGDEVSSCGGVMEVVELPKNGVGLADNPILVLVYFHKALRAEFAELRRIAVEALESGRHGGELLVLLRKRFEFLKLFYKYHSAAEDEVIFLALDELVKNVVSTYSLEHKSIDDLFDSVFNCLDVLDKEGKDNHHKTFQGLLFCIGTIQTTIYQHMLKEEEQVFPLLMQQFSSSEQASLIWQFMCSVPVTLLEDFLPWMISVLSADEQLEVSRSMKEIVPEEKLLQEVVISWIDNKVPVFGGCTSIREQAAQFHIGLGTNHETSKHHSFDGIRLWHDAIRKDLQEVLVELYQIRISSTFSDLPALVVQLNFIADTLIFYSKALSNIIYPLWNELAKDFYSARYAQYLDERKIEGLQRLLYYKSEKTIPLRRYVEKLYEELGSFASWINENLKLIEAEVFPLIRMNCSHDMQQWLLYTCLKMMPLGLIKCVITWFSAHLSGNEAKSALKENLKGPLANNPLASLLCHWLRRSYSGKSSTEKFKEDLREMFNSRCLLLSKQIEEDSGLSHFTPDDKHHNTSSCRKPDKITDSENKFPTYTCSSTKRNRNHDTSYTSGMNFHVSFPQILNIPSYLSQNPGVCSLVTSFTILDTNPMDHIIYFHKALKKDLEYLILVSAKLAENVGFLMDFHRCFHLLQFFYQIHSDSEDNIAFPALEAKGNFQNISHSYSIDHKLEGEQFIKISNILDEISKLHTYSNADADALGHQEPKYGQLCVKLHDMCISMHKVLCDHIDHEEIELLPLYRENFSAEEQLKITGNMLGRMRAESLKEIIPWLVASLTYEEQHAMMSLWRKATKNTKFDEWLREWWEGGLITPMEKIEEKQTNTLPSYTVDAVEVVLKYLVEEGAHDNGGISQNGNSGCISDPYGVSTEPDKEYKLKEDHCHDTYKLEADEERGKEIPGISDLNETGKLVQASRYMQEERDLPILSQEQLVAAIRRVHKDSKLDLESKSRIIQSLHTSRSITTQPKVNSEITKSRNEENISGQSASYRDPLKLTFGCKHYKRNCKLVSACCNKLYTCRVCHDDVADHTMDRKATAQMMCMRCLIIQPVGATCSTPSCQKLSMARYYCSICKFFDDEREIYHCPYCNLCRLGKGLGIDYFHCMNCNACMSRSLSVHICREKCFEDFCPICHEFIFSSSLPIKALQCGHLMHSACFQAYTCSYYTCPICSKSLGDMQVYFGMLDALLAEEKVPSEHAGRTQVILCNDCEKRGDSPFHWLYHKCPHCGSFNTRVV
ncbi:zinc finger protein BRUTUS-like At1g74770 [Apium graveolens]|uniref:zinc finger protein BRUTUS-like At1g74770 n=1 Tax=Apium graveolens TaxID=4045 RepID=UPI003D79A486